jgi:hypothetical protein
MTPMSRYSLVALLAGLLEVSEHREPWGGLEVDASQVRMARSILGGAERPDSAPTLTRLLGLLGSTTKAAPALQVF